MMDLTLDARLESVLFWKAEPVMIKDLCRWLKEEESTIREALATLAARLSQTSGVRLMEKDGAVLLGTAPEISSLLETLSKEELSRDLGRAALETLAAVLYLGPIPKSELDYLRGVNSSFILRGLLVRGLIEKTEDAKDARRFLYRPTFDLLAYLGLNKVSALPDYEEVRARVAAFKEERRENNDT